MKVLVLGAYQASDAYPNVRFRIADLRALDNVAVTEWNAMPPRPAQFSASWLAAGLLGRTAAAMALGLRNLRAAVRWLTRRDADLVYIPYPAAPLLWLLSLMPRRWRPARLVADVFISHYDTLVEDRGLVAAGSWVARALSAVERRAYRTADMVLADTESNAREFVSRFGLAPTRVQALPLAIDEDLYRFEPYTVTPGRCTVLFVGSFVPLQGTSIIAQAFVQLAGSKGLHLRVIGDGQCAPDFAARLGAARAAVDWRRAWLSAPEVRAAMAEADICLGVFGTSSKTARVWPFKNYACMALGRALVTGDTPEARRFGVGPDAPMVFVPCGDAAALASALRDLAENPARRQALAAAARRSYEAHLARKRSRAALAELLRGD